MSKVDVFETFEYDGVSIPFEHMGMCYLNAVMEFRMVKRNSNRTRSDPEYWDTKERRRFRELLGNAYAEYDEDRLHRCAVHFRKNREGRGGWKDWKIMHGIQVQDVNTIDSE
jgi:hypothetical protein